MLTFLDDQAAEEMDAHLDRAMLVSVWLFPDTQDYYILSNVDSRPVSMHILAGAVLEAVNQDNGSAH